MRRRSTTHGLVIGAALLVVCLAPTAALAASPAPGASHDHAAAGTPVSLDTPAAKLRVELDRLLAEHAFLTIEQMRSGLTGAPDFAAAAKAVEANSTEVGNAIGSVYGEAAIQPFLDIWRSHIGYLVDYAVALGKDDTAAQQQALDGLATYRTNIHQFLQNANPGVDLGGINDALDMHTAQLVEFVKAEHAGDHAGAYAIERQAYPHMFDVGDALAKVMANRFPDTFTGLDTAYSAAGTLRVILDRLLAEHAFLAAEVMRSGVGGDPSFDAGKAALDGNSTDLQGVIGAAYGDQASSSFRTLWDSHIKAYLDYIDAAKTADGVALTTATNSVNDYAAQLAGFLAGANPYLDAYALSTLFKQHAGHLTGQVEAYAAKDYDKTYSTVREGYSHMFTAGEALATGLAEQMPDMFPADAPAPATDALPEPHVHGTGFPVAVLLVLAVLIAGTALVGAVLVAAARRSRDPFGRRPGRRFGRG